MTGLISEEFEIACCEVQAAEEAYTRWVGRQFADGNWPFFAGLVRMRFSVGFSNAKWMHVAERHPITDANEIARYLQHVYDRMAHY